MEDQCGTPAVCCLSCAMSALFSLGPMTFKGGETTTWPATLCLVVVAVADFRHFQDR